MLKQLLILALIVFSSGLVLGLDVGDIKPASGSFKYEVDDLRLDFLQLPSAGFRSTGDLVSNLNPSITGWQHPGQNSERFLHNPLSLGDGYGYFMSLGVDVLYDAGEFDSSSIATSRKRTMELSSPVYLPDGAVIKKLDCYYYHNDPNWNFSMVSQLWKRKIQSTSPEKMITLSFGLQSGGMSAQLARISNSVKKLSSDANTIDSSPIENKDYQYYMTVKLLYDENQTSPSINMDPELTRFYGCRIGYDPMIQFVNGYVPQNI